MANKQDVQNAFYDGVCTILDSLMDVTGVDYGSIPVNLPDLREYAASNGFDEIAEQIDFVLEGE